MPGQVNELNLERVFTYQVPTTEETRAKYKAINDAAKAFAATLLAECPNCADRSTALRLVREARMWGNSSVALEGEV